jgi:hypothetical protein
MSASSRGTILTAALTVAAGAGVATAHGLYQVAAAARVTPTIAWLYPLMTDGLALVGYAATAHLTDRGRRYAASIVILAAGLSGLAQAVYLAGALDRTVAPIGLRFGVGAWPAVAAALTAHLLHLIAADRTGEGAAFNPASNPALFNGVSNPLVHPRPTGQCSTPSVQPDAEVPLDTPTTELKTSAEQGAAGSARERADSAARRHRDRHGTWPTVTELAQLAGTSRGTAGTVLKTLRDDHRPLHLVNTDNHDRTTP